MSVKLLLLLSVISSNIFAKDKVFYDERTDLYWTPVVKAKTFDEAKSYCANLRWYGINKWSLPTFMQFKTTVCKDKNYDNNIGCTNSREKDPLSILYKEGAGKRYWMLNSAPGRPKMAYLFKLDKTGKYSLAAKKSKHFFRCVSTEKTNTVLAKDRALNYRYNFILSAYYAYLTENLINTQNYDYDSFDARFFIYLGKLGLHFTQGITVEVDGGFSATEKSFWDQPNVIATTANWEVAFKRRISARIGIGGGAAVVPVNIQTSSYLKMTTETQYGFTWNFGVTGVLVEFGKYNRFSIILDAKYTGIKTNRFFGNIFGIGAGFGWKFKIL